MGIRDWKRDALTRAQRQERRENEEAWWQKPARQARQAGRKEKRQAGEAWWQVSGNATEPAAQVVIPPNLGARLPGPGTPGARTTGTTGGNGTANGAAAPWYMNPLFLAVAAGGAWYLFGKKK